MKAALPLTENECREAVQENGYRIAIENTSTVCVFKFADGHDASARIIEGPNFKSICKQFRLHERLAV